MTILKAEKRNKQLKGKHLRKAGIIPGVLYGSGSNESLSIQFSQKDVDSFLRSNSLGSKVELMIGDKRQMALLKEITYVPVTNQAEHLTFMPLIKGEKITSVAQIVLINKEKVLGNVQQSLFEISYKAFPVDLIDKIEVDLEGTSVGDVIRVADLEISSNDAYEVLSLPDITVCSIAPNRRKTEETAESDQSDQLPT
jgi:large subunit ribosomal protein L25